MTRTRGWEVFAAAALGMALANAASAGVEMTMEITDLRSKGSAPREHRAFVDGERLRMDMTGGTAVIFRGDRDLVWVLEPKQQTYFELTHATMTEIQQRADAAKAQMKVQLDKLPPAQRAQVEKLMNEHGEAAPGGTTVRATGRTDSVSGMSCREFEVLRGATKQSEVCVADWGAGGVERGDIAAFRKLGAWQEETLAAATDQEVDAMLLIDKLDGIPIRVRTFRGGKAANEMRVTKLEKKPVDQGRFDVPAGYAKKNPAREH